MAELCWDRIFIWESVVASMLAWSMDSVSFYFYRSNISCEASNVVWMLDTEKLSPHSPFSFNELSKGLTPLVSLINPPPWDMRWGDGECPCFRLQFCRLDEEWNFSNTRKPTDV